MSYRRASCLVLIVLAAGICPLAAQDPVRPVAPPVPPGPPVPPRPGVILVDDMWLPQSVVYGDGVFTATPWPNGNVRIAFSSSITSSQRQAFRNAWAEIVSTSHIDFIEVSSSFSGDFVLVVPNSGYPNVSSSEIGMQGGQQELRVGANHWDDPFVLCHEMMHALGYLHEQSRPDRDIFVSIIWSRISQTACNGGSCDHNFDVVSGATTTGPYDFESIMHYNDTAFSTNGQPTIVARPGFTQFQDAMGNRSHMTVNDTNALQNRYGQPSSPQITAVVPNAVEATTVSQLVIECTGDYFHRGSLDGDGVTGTRVRFDGVLLDTTFINEDTVQAIVPGSLLMNPGNKVVDIVNHNEAGGTSPSSRTFIVLPPPCSSQTDRVGQAVAAIGDVNGDGRDDYVVGTPGYSSDTGRIRCYSGATNAVLWTVNGPAAGSRYGFALASIGDITGDGRQDVLIGAPGYSGSAGRIEIRSGSNAALLSVLNNGAGLEEFGSAVAGGGDFDGDGDRDFLIGVPGSDVGGANTGRVEVWSTNGGLMRTHYGLTDSDGFGTAVAGGADLNSDDRPDYVIGAPFYDSGSDFDVGRVSAYSGVNGAQLTAKVGDGPYDRLGNAVAMLPNMNVFLAGAPEIGNLFSGSGNGAGYVRMWRGQSILLSYGTLTTWTGTTVGDRYGICVASAGDVDDDGYEDVLIGVAQSSFLSPVIGPGAFEIRSSLSPYELIYRQAGGSSDELYGTSLAALTDVDGDTRVDVVVGAPGSDVACLDAGAFSVVHPPVPPANQKLMITEVSTGNPDCVEITNFGTASASLYGARIRWKDGTTVTSPLLNITLGAGESCIVKEAAGTLAETPAGVQVLAILPSVGTTTGDVAVALINAQDIVVDEVHIESSTETYAEGSLGGKFRGVVRHEASASGETNAERAWGLDSNSGGDWTTGGPRTMGLENTSVGLRGSDPVALRYVRINEVDDNPDYIELYRSGTLLLTPSVDLQGWYLLCSAIQNSVHTRLDPFPTRRLIAPGNYLVIGDGAAAPSELPGGVPYINIATLGGNIPFTGSELSCALYDSYGRCIDTVRTTAATHLVAHNHPRAPAHPTDFTGGAIRTTLGEAAFGRNSSGSDTNTGGDFHALAIRTMGSSNNAFPQPNWTPSNEVQMNVRLNATALGGGIAAIIYAGQDHAGEKWTFGFSYGHINGSGPIIGLGPEAIDNWLITSVTPPFFGILDSRGAARLDIPPGTLPPGIDTDDVFLLQVNDGTQFAPLTGNTFVLEFDT